MIGWYRVIDLNDLDSNPFKWVQPNIFKRKYELWSQQDHLATLRWEKTDINARAVAAYVGGEWWIKSTRLVRPRVTIRSTSTDAIKAVFEAKLTGKGVLRISGGDQLYWNADDIKRNVWAFKNQQSITLMRLLAKKKFLSIDGQVEVEKDTKTRPDMPLLAAIGWYLLIMMTDPSSDLFLLRIDLQAI
jgi:hypothetical protein